MSLPTSCAPSSTITRRSANSDGLTSSASSGAVRSVTFTRVVSAVGSASRAVSIAARTARSTSSSSSPSTSCSAGGVTAGAFTPPSSHHRRVDGHVGPGTGRPWSPRSRSLSNDGPHIGRVTGSCRNVSGRQLNTAHPEGQRERPEEAPATGVSHVDSRPRERRRPRCQFRPARGTDEEIPRDDDHCRHRHHHARPRARTRPDLSGVRQPDPPRTRVRVRRVFRPARGLLRVRGHHPSRDRGGPQVHLALPQAAARSVRCGRTPEHRPRPHPAGEGRPAGRRARREVVVGQGRHRQPDALVQGPRGRRRARRRTPARLPRARLPVHRQPGQRGRGRGRPRRLGVGGPDPVVPRTGEGPDHRRVRRRAHRRRRQLRRREPPRHRTRRGARGLGVRERQRPARTTPRARRHSASRSPSSWAGACRTRWSCRSPPAPNSPRWTRVSAS